MSRRVNHLIAAITICALWLPLGARALGHHAAIVENRLLIAAPRIDEGWDFFKKLGLYINDHIPLRQRAIKSDAWVDVNIFKEDPSFGGNGTAQVITGSNGFLYINDAFTEACNPHFQPQESADHFARLASIIQASGRRVVTAVAPDKSSVLPQYLPKHLLLRECFDTYSQQLWSALDHADIPGFINLRDLLTKATVETRQPLYFRKDTHWDPSGSLIGVRQIVKSLDPALWDESQVSDDGVFTYQGDLTTMRGLPEKDEAPAFSVNRPGVRVVNTAPAPGYDDGRNLRVTRSDPSGRFIRGRTLFLMDSFGAAAMPQLGPFFEDLTFVSLNDFDPAKYQALINASDTVIIMSVERSFDWRMQAAVGSDSFLNLLSSSLEHR